MGHYWSEMASDYEMKLHEEQIKAAQHRQNVEFQLNLLGAYLEAHPDALTKLVNLLEES